MMVLQSVEDVHSDHTKAEMLLDISKQVRSSSSQVKEAYLKAANEIGSSTYRDRAVRAIE